MRTYYKKGGGVKSPAWQRKEGKDPSGGLNKKGVASYRRQNPGSKLQTAVTTKPSKLKKGSKAANRRKSFCARMARNPVAKTPASNILTLWFFNAFISPFIPHAFICLVTN